MRYIVAIFLALSLAACGESTQSAQASSGPDPQVVKCNYLRAEYAKAFHVAKANTGTEAMKQIGLMLELRSIIKSLTCSNWKLVGKIMDLDPNIGLKSELKSAPMKVPTNQLKPE